MSCGRTNPSKTSYVKRISIPSHAFTFSKALFVAVPLTLTEKRAFAFADPMP
jgi:hypothetical protein